MIYDVTHERIRIIGPLNPADNEYLEALRRRSRPKTYDRCLKTAREVVEEIVRSAGGKLIWTKAGAAFGHGSMHPKKRIDDLWSAVEAVFTQRNGVADGKAMLITVGSLLRWAISQRQETWLLFVRDTDERDPITNKLITISEYWVDDSFQPDPKRMPKSWKPKATLQDLAAKFNVRRQEVRA